MLILNETIGRLGQYHQSIQDSNEAVRLAPKIAIAYVNRAVSYTFLGNDNEAQKGIDRAVELGFDRGVVEGIVEGIRDQR